jgi:phosphoribosylformylglycinamidine cyclo-ligase
MYKVFNMGHRMEIYLPERYADDVISISRSYAIDAQIVGRVEKNNSGKLTIKTVNGTFVYE